MTLQRKTLLCRYHYDPLDRVASCAPMNQNSARRFYRGKRLATELQGSAQYSMFEHESQIMAQQKRDSGHVDCSLLATDLQRSILHSTAIGQPHRSVYSPYGHRSGESGLSSLLGFNGERRDPVTGHYLLGNGYRAFNPVLMRFNSPDSLSPFGKGGVNTYAYCLGDPVNRVDPNGQAALLFPVFQFQQGAARNVVSSLTGSVQRIGPTPAKNSANLALMSESPEIAGLDLAFSKVTDRARLNDAIGKRLTAESALEAASEKYSILERFAASPPREKDGTVAGSIFDPGDIVKQPAYINLKAAEKGADEARAVFEYERGKYFDRYPADYNALVRSNERRQSI